MDKQALFNLLKAVNDEVGKLGTILALVALGIRDRRTLTEVADKIGSTKMGITGTADRLEEAGLAIRIPHETDRRVTLLCLTDKGRELLG